MKGKAIVFFSVYILSGLCGYAQEATQAPHFSHADTLRGSLNPQRTWWKVLRYDISVQPDYGTKTISASNTITYRTLASGSQTMQIDLMAPLVIDRIVDGFGKKVAFRSIDSGVYHLYIQPTSRNASGGPGNTSHEGMTRSVTISYHGKPIEAVHPPWEGGWIWAKDALGRPWMSVACQGLGASAWYPCKDYQGDEPDSGASLSITVPDTLTAIGNGRLQSRTSRGDGLVTYRWEVKNPINNYDIIPYIGKYVGWHSEYQGEKGKLDCDFWVLDYELDKARQQFKQVDTMLRCFEYWMGPYPFYEDGYKLVQSPHLGMEHQSAVAYGNHFANGYLGKDLSGTGWGLLWDFIIVHESGHEWFGNNITTRDLADMWVHEGITNYSETLYTTCRSGVEAGNAYCLGTRNKIRNDKPIIGYYGVNNKGSGDMYYKGGNMMHTIRQIIQDDEKFRQVLRGLNRDFYHQTVSSEQVERYISLHGGRDLSKVFDQYLRTTLIPDLQYQVKGTSLQYRWASCVPGFDMPLKVKVGADVYWLEPVQQWKTLPLKTADPGQVTLVADPNFYVTTHKME